MILLVIRYSKALLCYNICRSLLASRFLSNFYLIPDLYAKTPAFNAKITASYADIFLFVFHCAGNVRGQVPVGCFWCISNDSAHTVGGRGQGHVGGNVFA